MSLNYQIVLTRAEDGDGWYAQIPLIGALGDGKTPNKAVADVRDALQGYISIMLEDGDVIPEPLVDRHGLVIEHPDEDKIWDPK